METQRPNREPPAALPPLAEATPEANQPQRPMDTPKSQDESPAAASLFSVYSEFARVLRTWFVAYGIGGPVLLLTNDAVQRKFAASGQAAHITLAFLTGVALQVLLAVLNKNATWIAYEAERRADRKTKTVYRLAVWFTNEFWIEFAMDMGSLVAFTWATYRAFVIVVS